MITVGFGTIKIPPPWVSLATSILRYDAAKRLRGASYFVMAVKGRKFVGLWRLGLACFCALGSLSAVAFAAQQPAVATVDRSSVPVAVPAVEGAAAVSATARFSLKDLDWLSGEWNGAWGPRMAHQFWSEPHAGAMVGTLQIVEGDKTLVMEMVELTNTPTGVEYRLLHFTPTLSPWETSGPAVLSLTSMDSKKIVFDNLSDGEPRQVIFMRSDPDTYSVRSQIAPANADPLSNEIAFHRKLSPLPAKKKK
jgi:hypothetical protein